MSLVGCLAPLTADQSSVCQTGLSPGTPNGAPFSCLVGGGVVGGIDGRVAGEEGKGLRIDRVTERKNTGGGSCHTDRQKTRLENPGRWFMKINR